MYAIPKNLLSKGMTNAKTAKNSLETYILYLSPYTQNSKGINLCPKASDGCIKSCLFTAGRGKFSNVAKSRINKSNYYVENKEAFLSQLYKELFKIDLIGFKENKRIAIRLNGTSDIDFIGQLEKKFNEDIFKAFPNLIFYDYTKIIGKIEKYQNRPYYLTFSRSEETKEEEINKALNFGANVSVVFSNDNLPKFYSGVSVVNGDNSDIVMIYNKSKILGLKAKGQAKKDNTNFVIHI